MIIKKMFIRRVINTQWHSKVGFPCFETPCIIANLLFRIRNFSLNSLINTKVVRQMTKNFLHLLISKLNLTHDHLIDTVHVTVHVLTINFIKHCKKARIVHKTLVLIYPYCCGFVFQHNQDFFLLIYGKVVHPQNEVFWLVPEWSQTNNNNML